MTGWGEGVDGRVKHGHDDGGLFGSGSVRYSVAGPSNVRDAAVGGQPVHEHAS